MLDGRVTARMLASFFDPEEVESMRGIYMLEPYDPKKIPVMCVHGLWSNPLTWSEFTNEFYGEPWIRNNYQLWVYLYPTGLPILYALPRAICAAVDPRDSFRSFRSFRSAESPWA